jgi:hypothetical protein
VEISTDRELLGKFDVSDAPIYANSVKSGQAIDDPIFEESKSNTSSQSSEVTQRHLTTISEQQELDIEQNVTWSRSDIASPIRSRFTSNQGSAKDAIFDKISTRKEPSLKRQNNEDIDFQSSEEENSSPS